LRLPFIAALLMLTACSRTTEGPTPTLTGALNPRQPFESPARVCNAQGGEAGWRINLLGERFTPIPRDVLTGEPKVGLPEVTLKGEQTLTLDHSRVFYRDSTLLFLDMPTKDSTPATELPPGTYAIEVKNPGGGTASMDNALIVVPPPTVTRVTAPQGFTFTAPSPLVIEGTGFRTDTFPVMKLRRAGAEDVDIFVSKVDSATRITAEIPSGTPEGTYDFYLMNPEGCEFTLPNALTIIYARLGLLTIEPRFGWQRRNQAITLYNAPTGTEGSFTGGSPEVFIVAPLKTNPAQLVDIPLNRVAFVSPTIVTAVVPTCSGNEALPLTDGSCPNGIVPGGPYALKVSDTSGVGEVPAARGFVVLENEPPVIDAISPSAIDTRGLDATNPLVVTGRNFGAGAKVQLLKQQATGNVLACDLPSQGTPSATSVSALVPTLIPAAQCVEYTATGTQVAATGDLQLAAGLFVVRVQNTADPAYANYSGLIVTNPAANPAHGPPLNTRLATARADFPLVLATDDLGQPFLYALGGTDGTNTLASVEVAPVTLFGDVGGDCNGATCTFRTLDRTPLGVGTAQETSEARKGLAAVVRTVPGDTSYLYVLGGVRGSDGATLATVERAQVLKVADAPALIPPERITENGATLPVGTLYYRVSAVLDGTDVENPNGETLPSDEYPVKANEALNAARLTWSCVPGAGKYRIYRTAAANERSGSERLLEEIPAPATPACVGSPLPQVSHVDRGTKTPAPDAVRPLPPGALGRWVRAGVAQLEVPRGNAAARLVGDRVYVSGGFCSAVGPGCAAANAALASVERGLFAANGLELLSFEAAGMLGRARVRHSMAIANASTAPNSFTPAAPDNSLDAWLVVAGGDQGGAPLSGAGIIEVAQIRNASGDIAAASIGFSAAGYNNTGSTHGGWTEIISNSLFQAGSSGGTVFAFRSGFVCPGTGQNPGKCDSAAKFSGNLSSTALAYQQGGPRYLGGSTLFRAFIYAAGGFPNDAGGTPTATLERIIY
jgi:hypothetical protein